MTLELMFKPIFDFDFIKRKYEKEYGNRVIELALLVDNAYDRQTFYVLEWTGIEYATRKLYLFLNPKKRERDSDPYEMQKMSQGSGNYEYLRDKINDLGYARDRFYKDLEIFRERGEY